MIEWSSWPNNWYPREDRWCSVTHETRYTHNGNKINFRNSTSVSKFGHQCMHGNCINDFQSCRILSRFFDNPLSFRTTISIDYCILINTHHSVWDFLLQKQNTILIIKSSHKFTPVPAARLWPDLIIVFHVRILCTSVRFESWTGKSFAKRVTDVCFHCYIYNSCNQIAPE